jgi:hypothetical protein
MILKNNKNQIFQREIFNISFFLTLILRKFKILKILCLFMEIFHFLIFLKVVFKIFKNREIMGNI